MSGGRGGQCGTTVPPPPLTHTNTPTPTTPHHTHATHPHLLLHQVVGHGRAVGADVFQEAAPDAAVVGGKELEDRRHHLAARWVGRSAVECGAQGQQALGAMRARWALPLPPSR